MSTSQNANTVTVALVTKGGGKAIHLGVESPSGLMATKCDTWGTKFTRRSTAPAATCKACIKADEASK